MSEQRNYRWFTGRWVQVKLLTMILSCMHMGPWHKKQTEDAKAMIMHDRSERGQYWIASVFGGFCLLSVAYGFSSNSSGEPTLQRGLTSDISSEVFTARVLTRDGRRLTAKHTLLVQNNLSNDSLPGIYSFGRESISLEMEKGAAFILPLARLKSLRFRGESCLAQLRNGNKAEGKFTGFLRCGTQMIPTSKVIEVDVLKYGPWLAPVSYFKSDDGWSCENVPGGLARFHLREPQVALSFDGRHLVDTGNLLGPHWVYPSFVVGDGRRVELVGKLTLRTDSGLISVSLGDCVSICLVSGASKVLQVVLKDGATLTGTVEEKRNGERLDRIGLACEAVGYPSCVLIIESPKLTISKPRHR